MAATLWLGIQSGFFSLGQIALIVVPMLVALEFLKDLGWLQRISQKVGPVLRPFDLPPAAAPALVAGLFIGLIYGAGVLYQTQREGQVENKEMTLLCLFLSMNHAVLEDVAILAAIGANIWVLVTARLLPALAVTYLLAWWYRGQRTGESFQG